MKYEYKTTGAEIKSPMPDPIAPDGDGWQICGSVIDKNLYYLHILQKKSLTICGRPIDNIFWFWQRKIPAKRLTKKKS
jgi:hypothetical protein